MFLLDSKYQYNDYLWRQPMPLDVTCGFLLLLPFEFMHRPGGGEVGDTGVQGVGSGQPAS